MSNKKFIKGSFAGKTFPIISGEEICKEGHVYIHLDTLMENPETVRLYMQTFDIDRNETGNIQMLLTQATAKEIGEQLSETLFDEKYRLYPVCPKCDNNSIMDIA